MTIPNTPPSSFFKYMCEEEIIFYYRIQNRIQGQPFLQLARRFGITQTLENKSSSKKSLNGNTPLRTSLWTKIPLISDWFLLPVMFQSHLLKEKRLETVGGKAKLIVVAMKRTKGHTGTKADYTSCFLICCKLKTKYKPSNKKNTSNHLICSNS